MLLSLILDSDLLHGGYIKNITAKGQEGEDDGGASAVAEKREMTTNDHDNDGHLWQRKTQ